MRKVAFLSCLFPLVATACSVIPDYEAPQPTASAEGEFITQDAAFDTVAPIPDQWWRLYRDPQLNALVSQALQTNTDLAVAAANLEEAQAGLRLARTDLLPSTDVDAGVAYGDDVRNGTGADEQWSRGADFAVSWEVDLFGRIDNAITAAKADAEAVEAVRDSVRVTVAAETTRAYMEACAYSLSLDVAQKSYDTSIASLNLVREQQTFGAADDLDVERAAARAATARSDIPFFMALRDRAYFELAAMLGKMPGDIPEDAFACTKPPELSAPLPVGDGVALLRRRPDLRQAERELAADFARIGVATAELYPTISLGGSASFFRSDVVRGSDSFSFSVGPMLSVSFPNLAAGRARVLQAEARSKAALAGFDGTVVEALKEVEQAMASVAREGDRIATLREAEERSQNAFDIADLKYRAGTLAYVDLLVAQTDLLDARATYAASVLRLSTARVDLFKALGGGWQDPEAAESGPALSTEVSADSADTDLSLDGTKEPEAIDG